MSHASNQDSLGAATRLCLIDKPAVDAWCRHAQCTEQELRAAVYSVGSAPAELDRYFQRPALQELSR